MGLDLGTRTLGISLSDTTHTIATLYDTIRFNDSNYDELIPQLKKIISENDVSKIILGLPKNMNNTIGPRALVTMEFMEKLKNDLQFEVFLHDERLTTVEASNYMIEADMS